MEFNKKYILPKRRDEHITLAWDRGYINVDIFFEGERIQSINNRQELLKGIAFENEKLGRIDIFFADSKYELGVKVEGFESPTNRNYPLKSILELRNFFLIPMIIHVLILIFLFYSIFQVPKMSLDWSLFVFPLGIHLFSILIYITSTILINKKVPLGYLIGLIYFFLYGIYSFVLPLILQLYLTNNIVWTVMLFFMLYFAYFTFLLYRIKYVLRAHKHWKLERSFNKRSELLDI